MDGGKKKRKVVFSILTLLFSYRKYEANRLNFAGDAPIPNHIPPILFHDHANLGGNPSGTNIFFHNFLNTFDNMQLFFFSYWRIYLQRSIRSKICGKVYLW